MEDVTQEEANQIDASGSLSVDSLRRILIAQLGEKAFVNAHARLQNVAQEDDDDLLVKDLCGHLGADNLGKLPMILKLIFLEEQVEDQ